LSELGLKSGGYFLAKQTVVLWDEPAQRTAKGRIVRLAIRYQPTAIALI
tara:strand:- start:362 stop:508 length:147 start_codon:yes stop_codon:yes gene_type:complete